MKIPDIFKNICIKSVVFWIYIIYIVSLLLDIGTTIIGFSQGINEINPFFNSSLRILGYDGAYQPLIIKIVALIIIVMHPLKMDFLPFIVGLIYYFVIKGTIRVKNERIRELMNALLPLVLISLYVSWIHIQATYKNLIILLIHVGILKL